MCKESEGGRRENFFVRMVTGAPEPMTVLTYDWSLDDIQRFCTQPQCTVLTVDPTFNLGDFDVTVTTYKHLLLKNANGCNPVMLGPVFVHQRKKFETYHFFASSLTGLKPSLSDICAFGTDGEKALSTAFHTVFRQAVHLRCFLHFKGNLEAKLGEFGVPKHAQIEFIRDVFGDPVHFQDGLVDAEGDDFEAILNSLQVVWDERERAYHDPPEFFQWFVHYCKEEVRTTMLKEKRRKVGLGDPPQPFYTNDVESMNCVIKHQTKYKAQELPQFIATMKSILDEQKKEIEKACAGLGEYRLVEEYEDLGCESRKFFLMTEKQRQMKVNALFTTPLRTVPEEYYLADEPLQTSQHVSGVSSSTDNPLKRLSIPDYLAQKVWKESSTLLENKDSVCVSPGCHDGSQWLVQSTDSTRKSPHFVEVCRNGQVKCEQSCAVFKSSKICAHSVAVAQHTHVLEEFISWLLKQKGGPLNVTKLASVDMPAGRGKKPKRKASSKQSSKRLKLLVERSSQPHTYRVQPQRLPTDLDEHSLEEQPTEPGPEYDSLEEQPSEPGLEYESPASGWTPVFRSPPPLIPCGHHVTHNVSLPYSPLVYAPTLLPSAANMAPPSTSPNTSQQPFWLTFVKGNITKCTGCGKRNLRAETGKAHAPSNDLCLQHKEHVLFENPHTGNFQLSKDLRNVYYHANSYCVRAKYPEFNPQVEVKVSREIKAKLTTNHLHLLLQQFGLSFLNYPSSASK